MNSIAHTEGDTHHMGPNAQIWGLYRSEEVVKCFDFCGRDATTKHLGEDVCEQCKAERIENDKEELNSK